MITIEAVALATMALVFMFTMLDSARSHTRSSAWAAPANLTPIYRTATQPAADTVINAQDRFAARRALASTDEVSNLDVIAEAA